MRMALSILSGFILAGMIVGADAIIKTLAEVPPTVAPRVAAWRRGSGCLQCALSAHDVCTWRILGQILFSEVADCNVPWWPGLRSRSDGR
jgi:hypothetical protein